MKISDIGPPDADIMLIGESPSAYEEKAGRLFTDQKGKMLQHMCRHSGIDWSKCYGTNVTSERPRRQDFGCYYVDKSRRNPNDELQRLWGILRDKVRELKPKVIVAFGAESLRAITGKRGIDSWRGCPLSFEGIPIIPTYAIGSLIKSYGLHPVVELDLQKARRYNEERPETKEWNIILEPTLQQVRRFLQGCRNKTVAFDLESISDTVRCIAFARDNTSICIPFLHFTSYSPRSVQSSSIIRVGEASSSDCASH